MLVLFCIYDEYRIFSLLRKFLQTSLFCTDTYVRGHDTVFKPAGSFRKQDEEVQDGNYAIKRFGERASAHVRLRENPSDLRLEIHYI